LKWGGHSGARTPCIWPASNSLADDTIWTRPKTVFFETVEHEGKTVPRFAPLADE